MTTRTRIINYNALVRKQSDYRTPDAPEYRFSNGRKFIRGGGRGVYASDEQVIPPLFNHSLDFSDSRNSMYIGL